MFVKSSLIFFYLYFEKKSLLLKKKSSKKLIIWQKSIWGSIGRIKKFKCSIECVFFFSFREKCSMFSLMFSLVTLRSHFLFRWFLLLFFWYLNQNKRSFRSDWCNALFYNNNNNNINSAKKLFIVLWIWAPLHLYSHQHISSFLSKWIIRLLISLDI